MNSRDIKRHQKQAVVFVLILSALIILPGNVFAAPAWWGTGGAQTFQQWSFVDKSSHTPLPTDVSNQYGTPTMWIGDRAQWSNNVWTLGTDEMDIMIPNNPELRAQKEIQIELTWSAGGQNTLPDKPLIGVLPLYDTGINYSENITLMAQDNLAGTPFIKSIFSVDIWPNPSSEWITVKGDINVSNVAVYTRCIPEPATFGLLIGGAFMAIRRKIKGLK